MDKIKSLGLLFLPLIFCGEIASAQIDEEYAKFQLICASKGLTDLASEILATSQLLSTQYGDIQYKHGCTSKEASESNRTTIDCFGSYMSGLVAQLREANNDRKRKMESSAANLQDLSDCLKLKAKSEQRKNPYTNVEVERLLKNGEFTLNYQLLDCRQSEMVLSSFYSLSKFSDDLILPQVLSEKVRTCRSSAKKK